MTTMPARPAHHGAHGLGSQSSAQSPRLLTALIVGSAVMCLVPAGCISFGDLAETGAASPMAGRCGSCHVEIFEEWRESPHAQAFLSGEFLARTDGGSMENCLPCHAPGSLPASPDRPLKHRGHAPEEGVNCLGCHRVAAGHGSDESEAVLAGPLGSDALVQPHPIRDLGDWFRNPALCGRCHQDTMAEWRTSDNERRPTCQACHMPVVRRKVTQSTSLLSKALVAFEGSHELRAHAFSIEAALGESPRLLGGEVLSFSHHLDSGHVRIRLTNHLPHALPTGGFGAHTARIVVRSDTGAVVREEILTTKRHRALAAGASRDIQLLWPGASKTLDVEVTAVHGGSDPSPPANPRLLAHYRISAASSPAAGELGGRPTSLADNQESRHAPSPLADSALTE